MRPNEGAYSDALWSGVAGQGSMLSCGARLRGLGGKAPSYPRIIFKARKLVPLKDVPKPNFDRASLAISLGSKPVVGMINPDHHAHSRVTSSAHERQKQQMETKGRSDADTKPPITVLAVMGPTAAGKSLFALELAEYVGGEIVNADAMQLYRGLDVGTAKPDAETRARVPHHLLDLLQADESFSVARYAAAAAPVLEKIAARRRVPIVCGGSHLYLRGLLDGLTPLPATDAALRRTLTLRLHEDGPRALHTALSRVDAPTAQRLHPHDAQRVLRALEVYQQTGTPLSSWLQLHERKRPPYRVWRIALSWPRDVLHRRIAARITKMLANGWSAEVIALLNAGYHAQSAALRAIGYREMVAHLEGHLTTSELPQRILYRTRQFAKRQLTWLRREPELHWLIAPQEQARRASIEQAAAFVNRTPHTLLTQNETSVTGYIVRRLLLMFPTLLGIVLITFVILQLVPGGPLDQLMARLSQTNFHGETTSPAASHQLQKLQDEQRLYLAQLYGFDQPLPLQFWGWVKRLFTFDFGESYYHHRRVVSLIIEKLPVSMSLGGWSFLLVYSICVPLGIAKAVRDGSRFDGLTSIIVLVGYSIPGFVLGLFLLVLFGGGSFWQVFPLRGLTSDNFDELSRSAQILDYLWHLILPLICYVIGSFSVLTMLTKNSFLEEIHRQYVLTARAKGLSERRVLYKHVLRNALIPIVLGFPASFLAVFFSGSLLIETLFSLDGLGLLAYESILSRDYPIVMATLFIFSLLALISNLLSDLTLVLIDPRISFEQAPG